MLATINGTSLKELRESKGLTVEQLSKLTKVPVKTIIKFENGEKISLKTVSTTYSRVFNFLQQYSN